jgi:putative addiction module component (TIGR02574 family)
MPTLEKQLATVALALPPRKRAKLAGLILDSIDTKRDRAIAAAWAVEAESRAKAHRKGLIKAIPVERAFGFSV